MTRLATFLLVLCLAGQAARCRAAEDESRSVLETPPKILIAQETYVGPSILPPAPEAIGGGNPFQGLGRSDDPGLSRQSKYGFPTYNDTGYNANGMQDFPAPVINSDSYANYRGSQNASASDNSGTAAGSIGSATANIGSGGSGNGPNNSSSFSSPPQNTGGFIPTSLLDSPATNQNAQSGANVSGSGASSGSGVYQNANAQFAPGFAGQAGYGTPSGAPEAQSPQPAQSVNSSQATNNQSGYQSNASGNGMSTAGNGAAAASASNAPVGTKSTLEWGQGFSTLDKMLDADPAAPRARRQTTTPGNFNSAPSSDALSDTAPPAPSTVPAGTQLKSSSPLSTTLSQIRLGRLSEARTSVEKVLHSEPENANAHYLKAVVCVLTRNFEEARRAYLATIKYSHNEELTSRARSGLSKLSH